MSDTRKAIHASTRHPGLTRSHVNRFHDVVDYDRGPRQVTTQSVASSSSNR